ncbi:MAG: hypothetical protein JO198_02985 [Candidatus Dormibacteraeota bacterium]|nr:hypothetical protein [Candidatus Dormibacteraeota bacterium]
MADLCSLSDPATARLQYHEFLLSHGCFDELHPSNICKELVGFDTFVAIVGTVIGGEAGGSEEAGAEAETAALSRFARGLAEPVSGETFDVVADPRKFSEYLLTPNASGRFQQLLKLGYQQGDVGAARTLSDAITQQAADAISAQDFQFAGLTNDGRFLRINLNVTIPGTGSAAGKSYTFTSGWYLDEDTGAFTFSTLLPPK